MKILITTDWYKPTINGVVTSVENLYLGLTAMGHEVRIAALSESRSSRREGDVFYYASAGADKVYPGARLLIPRNKEMTGELIRWHPDVVHSQCEFSTYFLAEKIAHTCNVPLIHTYHTVYEDYTHYFFHNKWLGRRAAIRFSEISVNHTDAVIVPSEKMRTILSGYRIHTPVYVIPSGIRLERFQDAAEGEAPASPLVSSATADIPASALTAIPPEMSASAGSAASSSRRNAPSALAPATRTRIRELYGIAPDEFLLVYLGRLAKEKNVEELLVLLSGMENQSQKLLVVGDGPAKVELERLAWKLGVRNRVIFTGMVSPEETAAYYRAGDVFVCASQSETQGLTYFEAMAAGLPILCRKDPCLTDRIEQGKNGFLYETPEEFWQIAGQLGENPQLRAAVGAAAKTYAAENCSVLAFAASCSRLYEQCIRDRIVFPSLLFGHSECSEVLKIC